MPQCILVVEDDLDCTQVFTVLLEAEGYDVRVASSLRDAYQSLARCTPPALILLDVVLPDGDGLNLCPPVRRRWPHLPVIVVSARADPRTRRAALASGCTEFLSKPFDPDEILARIDQVLQGRAARRPAFPP